MKNHIAYDLRFIYIEIKQIFFDKVTEPCKEEVKEYITTKRKFFYLGRRKSKNLQNLSDSNPSSQPPFISFEDLKKDLDDKIETKKLEPIILTEPGGNFLSDRVSSTSWAC